MNSNVYGYRNIVRLSSDLFIELGKTVNPVIEKQKTRFRQPLPAGLKIATPSQIPGHRGLLQEPDAWLQGRLQHHIPVYARGV